MNDAFTNQGLAMDGAIDLTLPPNGRVCYLVNWIDPVEASRVFAELERQLDWRQRPIRMFGREVLQPRLVCFYGTSGVRYRYSGVTLEAQPWGGVLEALAGRLSESLGESFNSVLCNFYRDGRDSMGWHADNEPELGREPVIASLSLGQARRFRFKPRGGGASRHLDLEHGSLLIMSGDLQHHWLHELPKSRRATGPRINLTFRRIV